MRTERLLILLALVVVGLGISAYVPLPSPVLSIRLPGAYAPLSVTLTPARQLSLVVALLACAAVDAIMRTSPHLAGAGLARTAPFWVLPVLAILWGFAAFEGLTRPQLQVPGLAVAALCLALLVIAQLRALDPADPWFGLARLVLNAVAYGLGFAAYVAALTLPYRGLVATPLIAIASAVLALEILASPRWTARRIWGSAALVGVMMAEVAWVLSSGIIAPLTAAFVLLLAFYALTGILQQRLWGRLRPHMAFEFLAVALAALALLRIAG